jgi:hypothetical protein
MDETLIDLGSHKRSAAIVRILGYTMFAAFGLVCLADLVVGREALPVRHIAGGVGLLILLLGVGMLRTRNLRPRWLGIDHDGVRLVNRLGRDLVRVAWGDLAGVGLMTDEAARARHLFAANLESFSGLNRRLVSVSVWLELFPAGPDALRRHPELHNSWRLGAARRPGQQQRWLLRLCDDFGQAPLPVGERVQRWRPDLWRGHRAGSVLMG